MTIALDSAVSFAASTEPLPKQFVVTKDFGSTVTLTGTDLAGSPFTIEDVLKSDLLFRGIVVH